MVSMTNQSTLVTDVTHLLIFWSLWNYTQSFADVHSVKRRNPYLWNISNHSQTSSVNETLYGIFRLSSQQNYLYNHNPTHLRCSPLGTSSLKASQPLKISVKKPSVHTDDSHPDIIPDSMSQLELTSCAMIRPQNDIVSFSRNIVSPPQRESMQYISKDDTASTATLHLINHWMIRSLYIY